MDIKMIKSFLSCYAPSDTLIRATDDFMRKYNGVVPEELNILWYNYGFGNYGTGILKLINPDGYKKNLDLFLKSNDIDNIPFMITGFGDIFYLDKKQEIYLYKIHYKKKEFCASNLSEFFKSYIISSKVMNNELRLNLYNLAQKELGELSDGDIYNFIPSISFGGKEQVDYIQKSDAIVSQNLLTGD